MLEGERGEVRSRSVGFWGAHSDVREEKGKEERRRKEMHFPASSSVGCRPEEEEHFSQPHDAAIVEPEYRFVLLPAGAFTFPLSLPPFTACLLQQCLFFSLHGGDVTGDAGSVPTRKGIAVSYGFFIFWVLEFFFISSTHLSVRDISTHS